MNQFTTEALTFHSSDVISAGTIFRKNRGTSCSSRQVETSANMLSKFSEVTPNSDVRDAPRLVPMKEPEFRILISVAKRVASTPSGQICAAKTSRANPSRMRWVLLSLNPNPSTKGQRNTRTRGRWMATG